MPEPLIERRRHPRVTLAAGHAFELATASTVQLVDISLGGVLVATPRPPQPGQRAVLQTRLGSEPLKVQVEVRRVTPERAGKGDAGRYRVGARFTGLDEEARGSIQRFLREGEA